MNILLFAPFVAFASFVLKSPTIPFSLSNQQSQHTQDEGEAERLHGEGQAGGQVFAGDGAHPQQPAQQHAHLQQRAGQGDPSGTIPLAAVLGRASRFQPRPNGSDSTGRM